MDNCFKKIGEILLEKDLISSEQLSLIIKHQKTSEALFGEVAIKLGFLREVDLMKILSELYQIEIVDLEFLYIKKEILQLFDSEIAVKYSIVPFAYDGNCVKIATTDPGDLQVIDAIKFHLKHIKIEFFLAKHSDILHFLEIMKSIDESFEHDPLLLLNKIMFDAIEAKASDIHFEPSENFIRVRVRIDGILHVLQTISKESWMRIKSKLKIISNLNITENRRPQSGHTRIYLGGKCVDLRISTHPDIYGENFVIRIFDLSNGVLSLSELGFFEQDYCFLKKVISFPSGLFLIVGPTGSGKTTTLYSLLKEINSASINIMTLEDPVEYQIEGIKQLDLREDGVMTFSDGVRSILRQDPDVMLIGEIRDEETAATAIRASLTGRLVLATLHAATPIEGIRRLLDLGLKISDVVPSLIGIFSQRLVRKLVDEKYKGRCPISEYIFFSDEKKRYLLNENDINSCEIDRKFSQSAADIIKKKITDKNEINRVFGDMGEKDYVGL